MDANESRLNVNLAPPMESRVYVSVGGSVKSTKSENAAARRGAARPCRAAGARPGGRALVRRETSGAGAHADADTRTYRSATCMSRIYMLRVRVRAGPLRHSDDMDTGDKYGHTHAAACRQIRPRALSSAIRLPSALRSRSRPRSWWSWAAAAVVIHAVIVGRFSIARAVHFARRVACPISRGARSDEYGDKTAAFVAASAALAPRDNAAVYMRGAIGDETSKKRRTRGRSRARERERAHRTRVSCVADSLSTRGSRASFSRGVCARARVCRRAGAHSVRTSPCVRRKRRGAHGREYRHDRLRRRHQRQRQQQPPNCCY